MNRSRRSKKKPIQLTLFEKRAAARILWTSLPEASRSEVSKLLSMLMQQSLGCRPVTSDEENNHE